MIDLFLITAISLLGFQLWTFRITQKRLKKGSELALATQGFVERLQTDQGDIWKKTQERITQGFQASVEEQAFRHNVLCQEMQSDRELILQEFKKTREAAEQHIQSVRDDLLKNQQLMAQSIAQVMGSDRELVQQEFKKGREAMEVRIQSVHEELVKKEQAMVQLMGSDRESVQKEFQKSREAMEERIQGLREDFVKKEQVVEQSLQAVRADLLKNQQAMVQVMGSDREVIAERIQSMREELMRQEQSMVQAMGNDRDLVGQELRKDRQVIEECIQGLHEEFVKKDQAMLQTMAQVTGSDRDLIRQELQKNREAVEQRIQDVRDDLVKKEQAMAQTLAQITGSDRDLIQQEFIKDRDTAWQLVKSFREREIQVQDKYYSEIEALFSLFASLKIRHPLPPMRSWAICPDVANILVDLIREKKPGVILELGSGVSTLIAGYVLKELKKGRIVSLEHEKDFLGKCQWDLEKHELKSVAEVIHAPLEKIQIQDKEWQWYGLGAVSRMFGNSKKIDMLIIDGPPGEAQSLARYPALPMLFKFLSDDAVVILDDALRADEQSIIKLWLKEFTCFQCEEIRTEKGVAVFRRG